MRIACTSCSAFLQGQSAENRSFKVHYGDLFVAIQNPVSVSTCLYSADLLSRSTKNKIYELPLTEQKVSVLLDATETAIRLKPQNFYKFVQVLEMHSSGSLGLCDKLRNTCCESDYYFFVPLHFCSKTAQFMSQMISSSASLSPTRSGEHEGIIMIYMYNNYILQS